eukprot:522590-Amphidinium_carterae.1
MDDIMPNLLVPSRQIPAQRVGVETSSFFCSCQNGRARMEMGSSQPIQSLYMAVLHAIVTACGDGRVQAPHD